MSQSDPPEAIRFLAPDLFSGQVAVVTGGGTGLGLQISRGLAALGATVVIASRSAEHHQALLEEGDAAGWRVYSETVDVREADRVRELADRVVEKQGKVDILVNNAAGNFVCPAEKLSAKAWRAVLGIVLDGTFYCSRSFGRHMIAAGGGQMLNVLATYAWTGMPGVVHSASAKAGVLAMTRTLAVEWARHGIRVNAIAPGPFESKGAEANLWPSEEVREAILRGVPLGRFATPDEVASHALFLLSPACAYVNGEVFVQDGGASLGKGMWTPGDRVGRRKA
ncbi:SDR family oxidoreductase [Engelhardtia mirabilis]|uniref:Peroxisomal trans-2-enoyl-CoA reductase n=1 Tax=Engelhardtia mirabilis TaxID=2528011 RepID=A0A518BHZ8_9BACT|nr:putative 2,4-dienoyl-CoA reductase [Planctomycetes bacterium Pla133]QDV00927.1 putative 2,4-dienoyl-CoA reductase [Planctomycetes bacterium Pla86]